MEVIAIIVALFGALLVVERKTEDFDPPPEDIYQMPYVEGSKISPAVWHYMEGHTPWETEYLSKIWENPWFMVGMQNELGVKWKRREQYREGLEGCKIIFHQTDQRWSDDEAKEAEANQYLIMYAPLLYQEVVRLRKIIHDLKK
jgi:lipopolysaccharide biosynthesis glycosyltransferase